MSVRVGQKAPDFTAPAYHKGGFTSVKLADFAGKWVTPRASMSALMTPPLWFANCAA